MPDCVCEQLYRNITVCIFQVRDLLKKKKGGVLQFVSHCRTPSRREVYIQELKKYINVTQLGTCSLGKRCTGKCEKKAIGRTASKEHLFYLFINFFVNVTVMYHR